jgi:hypothetical protein
MAKYLSQLNRNLKVGVSSYTEQETVLEVIGKVGIKTDDAKADLHVQGDALITGKLSVSTQVDATDVYVSGVSSFRGNVSIGSTEFSPTRDLDVGGPALFRDYVDVENFVSATEYYGPLRFGEPDGGFKPGAIEITIEDYTKNSINDINFILGKLVPKPPVTIQNAPLTIVNLGLGILCNGFTPTNNTLGDFSVSAGTQYPRNTSNVVTSSWLTEYGPGDQGIVSGVINFTSVGFREMTSNDVINPDNTITNDAKNDNGLYGALEIANDKDAFFSGRSPGIASDFYEVYDSRIIDASSPNGFNMAYIKHQVGANIYQSQKYLWYEDPSTVGAPILTPSTPTPPASPSVLYSSGIPHYTQSSNNAFSYNIVCQNATGDMYSNYTFLTSSGQTTGFQNGGNKTYGDFTGGTNPPVRNFGVGVGVTCTVSQIPRDLHIRLTSDSQKFSSYTASTPYGSDTKRAVISQIINIMGTTARTDVIDEDNILIQTLGTGSGNARRVNAGASGDNPTPVFTSWVPSNSISSYEAVVVGGDLKHDQTNYSAGYLPVGPNYSSGRSGSQYFQLEMIRSNVSEFQIVINGTYSGCWVCMPNNSAWMTSLSGTNGWANMFQAYRGSGIPTSALPGCAFAGNMTGGTGTFTCVFGTESSSNDANNRILVRFKLNSGNQINTLSFRNT